MTEAAAIIEAAAVNAKMISTLLVIYRVAHRALSAEERVGQQIQRFIESREGLLLFSDLPSPLGHVTCIVTVIVTFGPHYSEAMGKPSRSATGALG